MAELEVLEKKENPLLKRTEIRFKLTHAGEKTPQRGAIRDKLAATVGKKGAVVVDYMRSRYGSATTFGYAKIYASDDEARKSERDYLLKRNGLYVEKKKGEPKKKEEKPAA